MSFISLQACNAQNSSQKAQLKELALKESTLIVDVRTAQEYADAHYEKSVNIPLDQLTDSIAFLQQYDTIITICRSGNRSETAKKILIQHGLENVVNGGGWQSFKKIIEE